MLILALMQQCDGVVYYSELPTSRKAAATE